MQPCLISPARPKSLDHAEDVVLAQDQVFLAIDLHFGAGVLAEEDAVALLQVELPDAAVLEDLSVADRTSGEKIKDLVKKRIEKGMGLKGVDLRNANLSEVFLHNADLTNSIMIKANMSGAKMKQANLKGCKLVDADFTSADLSGANFSGSDFTGAIFNNANLSGANMAGARFDGADLSEAFAEIPPASAEDG